MRGVGGGCGRCGGGWCQDSLAGEKREDSLWVRIGPQRLSPGLSLFNGSTGAPGDKPGRNELVATVGLPTNAPESPLALGSYSAPNPHLCPCGHQGPTEPYCKIQMGPALSQQGCSLLPVFLFSHVSPGKENSHFLPTSKEN